MRIKHKTVGLRVGFISRLVSSRSLAKPKVRRAGKKNPAEGGPLEAPAEGPPEVPLEHPAEGATGGEKYSIDLILRKRSPKYIT